MWSPNSEYLAFVSRWDDKRSIEILSIDGNSTCHHDIFGTILDLEWSPKSEYLALEVDYGVSLSSVYSLSVSTCDLIRLTLTDLARVHSASWGPNGEYIAIVSNHDDRAGDIYLAKPDGNTYIRLTDHEAHDSDPTWSPGGEQIAFISNRTGKFEVFVMNADGSNQTKLTSPEARRRAQRLN
jgi:TolB protein